jgi:heme/copper-type cytochrome/quinol oxidase subunit 2
MSNSGLSELYFIAAMMILTLIGSGVAVFFFVRTFKREKREKEAARKQKIRQKTETEIQN